LDDDYDSDDATQDSISPLPHYEGFGERRLVVGKGFLTQYLGEGLSARVKDTIRAQQEQGAGDYELLICGHSLGGALATICAYELAITNLNRSLLLVTFGSPRTVNQEFAKVLARLPNLKCYRVSNGLDGVTRQPPFGDYQHVGHLIWLHLRSVQRPRPFGEQPLRLKAPLAMDLVLHKMKSVRDHSMSTYVNHMVDDYGWRGYLTQQSQGDESVLAPFSTTARRLDKHTKATADKAYAANARRWAKAANTVSMGN